MVVFPNATAQELDSPLPHARGCRPEASEKLARLVAVREVGASRGVQSRFPPQGVKDNENGDRSGEDDNPAAKQTENRRWAPAASACASAQLWLQLPGGGSSPRTWLRHATCFWKVLYKAPQRPES